jgi:succinate dehydrogenase / fumarate reductase flavoprotein subunit
LSDNYQSFEYDVLVIGAGGAGLRAAIEASAAGCKTGLVCKSLLGKAHTVMAEGGIAAALATVDSRDSWQQHFVDSMIGGNLGNHWRMAQIHAQQAPDRVKELEKWGAVFDRTNDGKGNINVRHFGGHTYKRLAHVGDRTGLELIRTLQDKGVHSGIDVHMECTIYSLMKDGDRIAGAYGYFRETGRPVLFKAKSIIVSTGGIGKLYFINSNSWECAGDGFGLSYLAGAELADMEYIQFHPTGMVWPPSVRGLLITEGVRGEGGVLKNNKGERFMFKYIPEKFAAETADTVEEAQRWLDGDKTARRPPELLTRDEVARSINAEVKAGRGSPHGGVFLDIASRRPADFIKRKLPSMYHQFKELAEVDITTDPMEVGPTLHYFMGGVRVDADSQMSTVPGLFACGECGAGLHGANRLGGNSLSDLLVFGRLAGVGAADYIKGLSSTPKATDDQIVAGVRRATDVLKRDSGTNPYVLHDKLQETMFANVGIIREGKEIEQALQDLEGLKKEAETMKAPGTSQYNPGWHEALSMRSLLITSEVVTRAALMREESRGAHTRNDFPGEREEWVQYNVIVKKGASGMEVEKRKRPDPPPKLKEIAYAKIEDLESGKVGGDE